MSNDGQLLGQGVHFPPRISAEGRWAWSSGSDNIRQAIQIILQTEPQERLSLPEFGGGLKRLLFQPNVSATHRLIEEAITKSLERWERRIRLTSVDVEPDPGDARAAIATVRYSLVAIDRNDQVQVRIALSS